MCDNGNIFNESESSTIYDCANIGSGESIYAGNSVLGNVETFEFKSLVAGDNVTLTSDASTITISSTDTGLVNLANLGGGAAIGQSIVSDTLNLRTIISTNTNTVVTQNANTVDIRNDNYNFLNIGTGASVVSAVGGYGTGAVTALFKSFIGGNNVVVTQNSDEINIAQNLSSAALVYTYNYMQDFSTNLAPAIININPITSNSVQTLSNTEGVFTQLTNTTGTFRPAARTTAPTYLFATTQAGSSQRMIAKLYPNLSVANDAVVDYLLGVNPVGQLYQINPVSSTEIIMKNYDGTNVSPFGATTTICMNIQDNLLYYVLSASNTTIRYYDFTNKTTGILLVVTSVGGWTAGAVISGMSYSEKNSCLYVSGDLNNSRVLSIPINPYDRSFAMSYGTPSVYASALNLGLGGTIYDIAISENNLTPIYTAIPTLSNATIYQQPLLGTNQTGTVISAIPVAATYIYSLTFAASGRLYFHENTTRTLRRFNQSIGGVVTTVFVTVNQYTCMTRCPYGIIA